MNTELRRALLNEFAQHGWDVDATWLNSCSKRYTHAGGGTTCVVYLYPRDCGGVTLKADYTSEGNNVLSTVWYPVDLESTDEVITEKVKACTAEIEDRISKTYGMRVMRLRQQAQHAGSRAEA